MTGCRTISGQRKRSSGRLRYAPGRCISLAALGVISLMQVRPASADTGPGLITANNGPGLITANGPAVSASNGPILVAARPTLDPFFLLPTAAWVDVNYFRDDENQKTRGTTSSQFTEDRFQEILTLQTAGYILHPNLVELKFQGSFGLEQDLISENGQNGTSEGILYDWDAEATLFRKEQMPVTLYSRRITSYYSQPFGPSLQNIVTTEGAIFDWQNKTVPTRVEYYHLSQDQKALDGSQDYQESQDTLTWHSSYQPTQQNHTTFDYTLNSGSAVSTASSAFGGQTTNDFTDNTISLNNELDFGTNARNKLQSSLLYYLQTGTYELSELHYNESLYLQYNDDFSTTFRYLLDKETVGGGFGGESTDQLLQRGDILFTHHLFKSLITIGDIGVQSLNVDPSGGDTDWFATLAVNYIKEVPFGKVTANIGLGYDLTDNNATNQITHIVNQRRMFSGPQPLIITANNIIADSLIITDSSGVRVYRQGLDYAVRSFPDYLEIERLLGGNIQDGQTVLLSYDLAAQPANTLRTNSVSFGGRYDFDKGPLRGLGIYGHYIDQDQSVSSSIPESFVPNSLVDKTIGFDYRVWEVRFLAEQDWHHSTISPYDQLRLDLRWVHPITPRASFTFNPSYIMAKYPQNNDQLTSVTIVAGAEYRVSHELSVNGSVYWLDETDRLFGPTRGLQEELEVKWSHRQTTAYLQFRNSNIQSDIQTNQYQTIQIGFRRNF